MKRKAEHSDSSASPDAVTASNDVLDNRQCGGCCGHAAQHMMAEAEERKDGGAATAAAAGAASVTSVAQPDRAFKLQKTQQRARDHAHTNGVLPPASASSNSNATLLASFPVASAAAAAAAGIASSDFPRAVAPVAVYDESARLAALFSYSILRSDREAQFNDLVKLAADLTHCPMALITFVEEEQVWFKAETGMGGDTCERSLAFCDVAIKRPAELMQVEDATLDPRFSTNPLVTGPPHIRFYAGAPLVDPNSGQALGTMCVIDTVPRTLSELQKVSLKLLARQVMAACECRRRIVKLENALQQLEETRTALKASKEQAEQAFVLAEQANHAKSEFLANMSHEIRTPLNGVLGTASLLAETTRLDFEQKDYVRVIQSSGEHLLIVLNDILDFSKFESGKLEIEAGRVDLQSMLEQAVELSFKPKPHLELVYEISPDVPAVIVGDVTRLRQICANLISNACKFTLEGQIIIRVERMGVKQIAAQQRVQKELSRTPPPPEDKQEAPEQPSSCGSCNSSCIKPAAAASSPVKSSPAAGTRTGLVPPVVLPDDDATMEPVPPPNADPSPPINVVAPALRFSPYGSSNSLGRAASTGIAPDDPEATMLVISVADSGIGIEPGKMHKLFSAFTQLDISITREYGGTGLGLAISARLAQLMGGTMWCKSEVGKGSTFYCSIRTVPFCPRSQSSSSTPSNTNSPMPLESLMAPPSQRTPPWTVQRRLCINNISSSMQGMADGPQSASGIPTLLRDSSHSRGNSPTPLHHKRAISTGALNSALDPEVAAAAATGLNSPFSPRQSAITADTANMPPTLRLMHFFPALAAASTNSPLAPETQQRTRVLLVEPNTFLLTSLSTQLTRWGFTCETYPSIAAALEQPFVAETAEGARFASMIISHPCPAPPPASGAYGTTCGGPVQALIRKVRALDKHEAGGANAAESDLGALDFVAPPAEQQPAAYIVPAIVLIPCKPADGLPCTPPVTDDKQFLTTMRKPALYSKLQTQLNKAFHMAFFGIAAPAVYSPSVNMHVHSPGTLAALASHRTVAPPQPMRPSLPHCALGGRTDYRPVQPSSRAKPSQEQQERGGCGGCCGGAKPVVEPSPEVEEPSPISALSDSASPPAAALAAIAMDATPSPSRVTAAGGVVVAAAVPAPVSAADPTTSDISHALSASQSFAASHPLRILVVEDNAVNMKLVVKMLSTLGYTDVAQAWDGQEAVERVVTRGEQYSLIFMDNVMPLLTGPAACARILAHYRSTGRPAPPVIIALTASCMEGDREEALRSGHADFLSKPISLPLLKAKVHQWARWIHKHLAVCPVPTPQHQQHQQQQQQQHQQQQPQAVPCSGARCCSS